jgi:hypothetical protein
MSEVLNLVYTAREEESGAIITKQVIESSSIPDLIHHILL